MHVKDKRIELDNFKYRAVVEYYRDNPNRDHHKPVIKIFETMSAAQKFLTKFPCDIWDGFAIDDHRYKEIDERKTKRETNIFNGKRKKKPDWIYGRTILQTQDIY